MSTEVKKEKKIEEPTAEPVTGMKKLLQIAEVRMLLYVIPVALVLLVVALLLNSAK
jgi:hypothetical protein